MYATLLLLHFGVLAVRIYDNSRDGGAVANTDNTDAAVGVQPNWFPLRDKKRKDVHPIMRFNQHLASRAFLAGLSLYYQFATSRGEHVWAGTVRGMPGARGDAKTVYPLASMSKLLAGFAFMRTMELRPKDWYPEKYVHEFEGWHRFCCFDVYGENKKANLTLHHLLTHTSGLPFELRDDWEGIRNLRLYYRPGTKFGYTIGHRVLGWLLHSYWMGQPEGKLANIQTVQDTFSYLVFRPLGMSSQTRFKKSFRHIFGYDQGGASDSSIKSTAEDVMKLAVVALRKGSRPDGEVIISLDNWNKWAVPNLLPDGKMTQDLVDWDVPVVSPFKRVMRQAGDYGWNYFGGTYKNSEEIGWCGFFSGCLRVSYVHSLAFVMLQRDVADLKKSKTYVNEHFEEMAVSLKCRGEPSCVTVDANTSRFCVVAGERKVWSDACPSSSKRGRHYVRKINVSRHTCYLPPCPSTAEASVNSK